jgi:hypothetical protein
MSHVEHGVVQSLITAFKQTKCSLFVNEVQHINS